MLSGIIYKNRNVQVTYLTKKMQHFNDPSKEETDKSFLRPFKRKT